ncbi:plasmid partitioning/stability family protein [Xenorhabdus sp. XENO-1]|uniref:plasmid partitioning/stability family protein n=1 Tax=Xenorhabdus bovienii TaxID=40576 RepID=UPI0020CA5C73|nr:plasmid partitioning/stability family protein [Xenorhabdus bovienii]MCP9269179.1 plasmid partitioning/stability family protein [Xenorhabdus bovienii subsp. africana]
MSDSKTKLRKCSFYINPEYNVGDRVANALLDKMPVKERGRTMRAMMLAGAALMLQEQRLPFMIAEFLDEHTTLADIHRIISNILPVTTNEFDTNTLINVLSQLTGRTLALSPTSAYVPTDDKGADTQPKEETVQTDQNEAETRANSAKMFSDDD